MITYEEILENCSPLERKMLLKVEKAYGRDFMLQVCSLGVVKALGGVDDNISNDGDTWEREKSAYGGESSMEIEA